MRSDRYLDNRGEYNENIEAQGQGAFDAQGQGATDATDARKAPYDSDVSDARKVSYEPYVYHEPEEPKEKFKLKVFFAVLIMLCCLGYLAHGYYLCYMNVIKVDVWELVDGPSFIGVEGEGTVNPISFDKKKLKRYLAKVEEENTTDRAVALKKLLKNADFEVTPSEKLSNGSTVTIKFNYDTDFADKYRLAIISNSEDEDDSESATDTENATESESASAADNKSDKNSGNGIGKKFGKLFEKIFVYEDWDNISPIQKEFKVEGLRNQANDSQILEQLKSNLSGTYTDASFERFYKLVKGEDETRFAVVMSVKENGRLRYVCYLTEKITPNNALSVSCSEIKPNENVTDYKKFLTYFKEEKYTVYEA